MPDSDIQWDFSLENTFEGRLFVASLNRVKGLGLPSIQKENIVNQSLAWVFQNGEVKTPCVVVSVADDLTDWKAGTNEHDQVEFGVFITMILANTRDVSIRGVGLQMEWRRAIRQAFQNLSQRTFTEFTPSSDSNEQYVKSKIESGRKYIESAKKMQRDAHYFLVRHAVREPRLSL